MKRTPLRRKTPLKRLTRLKPLSGKRKALQGQRRVFVAQTLLNRPRCEVVEFCGPNCRTPIRTRCLNRSEHVHEKLTRARGGSVLDPLNVLAVCAMHHRQIHDNPAWATALELLESQYGR